MTGWRDGPVASTTPRVDGTEVLRDLGAARPTARLRLVDAGDLYLDWVWNHQLTAPRMSVIPRDAVTPALLELAAAVPNPLSGESGHDALRRALGGGALLDPDREQRLADALTRALIPQWLGLELNALEAADHRPHLRIQPSPSTAQVPWESLGTSGRERTVDSLDVSVLLPASLRNDPLRTVSTWDPDGAVVAVLDPAVPGFPAGGELGSVLGTVPPGSPLAELVSRLGDRLRPAAAEPAAAFRRGDVGRDEFARLLDGAARVLYVGHVTASTHALDARLHLADSATVPGRATPVGGHRPLSAADIALGAPGSALLVAPNRVALVACDSGGDLRFAEPTGLVSAFTHRGAEYVTATRWTLPTDAGFARFAPSLANDAEGMLADAVLAVDAAHRAPDPIAALGDWQRSRRRQWTDTGDPRYSPLLWAAFTTAWSPAPAGTPPTSLPH
ncbi:CHAT domain-containing protein [Tsukamurella pseudospumae]|uniref:CHAT domain-containing protein n=1 Tax=Tsukamurella pseudospumae TaxID=239498 RepID=A0A138AV21_9ACTN|nr:CHAT domain-containing protein [Tsukamurella pseudospumae]KXP14272.1 hypothetical protein AXK60_20855 [Tsukamurella pseudospumae]